MYPYVVFFIFIFFTVFLSLSKQCNDHMKEVIVLVMLLLFVFSLFSLRYNVGADYVNYNKIYVHGNSDAIERWEIGFRNLFNLFRLSNISFYVFTSFILAVNTMALFIMLRKEAKIFVLGAAIYFLSMDGFFASISFYRQSLSVSLFMISIVFLLKNKWISYISLNLIGILFHYSSFIVLPMIALTRFKLDSKALFISAPIILYVSGQLGLIQDFIVIVLRLSGIYLEYIKTDAFSGESGIGLSYLVQLFIFIFLLSTSNIDTDRERKIIILYTIYMCLSAISINLLLFYRLSVVFSPIQAIAIPMLIFKSKVKHQNLLSLAVITLYSFLFLRVFFSPLFIRDFTPFNFIGLFE